MKFGDMLWAAMVALVGFGCRSSDREAPGRGAISTKAATLESASPSSPHAALAALDGRIPLPLLPMMANHQKQNMREHLVIVQQIVEGIAAVDFARIQRVAAGLGFSEQMGAMCTHMGAATPGFSEAGLAFHHTADRIGEAASRNDMKEVLASLNDTLNACTSCHATYKEHVVDEASWAALTSHHASPPRN